MSRQTVPHGNESWSSSESDVPLLSRRRFAGIQIMRKNNKEAQGTAQTSQGDRLISKRLSGIPLETPPWCAFAQKIFRILKSRLFLRPR
jgi:hypothetical protein